MTNRKTNEEIAELSCQFANYYFDDGAIPLPTSLLAKQSEIQADRKVLTRLVPRFVAAHSFFSGYAKAVEDEIDGLHVTMSLGGKINGKPTMNYLRELLGATRTEGLISAVERVAKERDELLSRVVTTNVPTDEQIREWVDRNGYPKQFREGTFDTLSLDKCLMKFKAEFMLKTAEQANIGIVVKPPPPPPPPAAPAPMPNEIPEEVAFHAARYAHEQTKESYEFRPISHIAAARSSVFDGIELLSQWGCIARGYIKGAMEFRGIDRTTINTLQEAAKVREGVNAQLHAQIDELRGRLNAQSDDVHTDDNQTMYHPPANEVQNSEREQYEQTIRLQNETIAATAAQAAEWRDQLERRDERLIFRSDDEREYWDSMTFMLARKGDTTAQSVSNAADEMVQERRARMPQQVKQEPEQATEVTDELLSEAATYANERYQFNSTTSDVWKAREALKGQEEGMSWYDGVRDYVAGAIRKARKQ
jgi:hypothetical protein